MAKKDIDLKAKADQLLQEIRIVLPGTQALLGFQFIAFFNPVFQSLPNRLHYLHFVTLLLTMIATILLIAPVAFQQIGENGNITQRFISFGRNMIHTAMWLLLIAFCGDLFLAARAIGIHAAAAGTIAACVFTVGAVLWYVYVKFRSKNS